MRYDVDDTEQSFATLYFLGPRGPDGIPLLVS